MPVFQGSGRGDLYVEYNVVLPRQLSPERRRSKSVSFEVLAGADLFICFRVGGSI